MKGNEELGRSGELNTIIGKGSVIEGNFRVQNSMRIDGHIKGNIHCTDTVVIGKEGEVLGEIKAGHVLLAGKLVGKISVDGKVHLESKAIIQGDIKATRLVVEEGAVFNGHCEMGRNHTGRTENTKTLS